MMIKFNAHLIRKPNEEELNKLQSETMSLE